MRPRTRHKRESGGGDYHNPAAPHQGHPTGGARQRLDPRSRLPAGRTGVRPRLATTLHDHSLIDGDGVSKSERGAFRCSVRCSLSDGVARTPAQL